MQEMWVWSLGWEDPLEKEMAPHSSTLAWEIPWTEEPGGLQSMGSQKSQTERRNNNKTKVTEGMVELESHQQILKLKHWCLMRTFTCSQCVSHKGGCKAQGRNWRHDWSQRAALTGTKRWHALSDKTHWTNRKQPRWYSRKMNRLGDTK